MSMFATSLLVGLAMGVVYGVITRLHKSDRIPNPGALVVLRWSRGLGRGRVLKAKPRPGAFLVTSPLMREAYDAPLQGEKVGVRVLGRDSFRAEFLGRSEDHWILRRLKS